MGKSNMHYHVYISAIATRRAIVKGSVHYVCHSAHRSRFYYVLCVCVSM